MNYNTTSEDQNKLISINKRYERASLDENLKNDLRKSHFNLGNDDMNYQSEYTRDYAEKKNIDASPIRVNQNIRSHNYNLGSDPVNYVTETHDKFNLPNIDKNGIRYNVKKNMHHSNCVFGTDDQDWMTSLQAAYFPKVMKILYRL